MRSTAIAEAAWLVAALEPSHAQRFGCRPAGRNPARALNVDFTEGPRGPHARKSEVLKIGAGDRGILAGIGKAERGTPRASDRRAKILGQSPGETDLRVARAAFERAVILVMAP